MTYRENVNALLARENTNYNQITNNVNFNIDEIRRQEEESIKNIKKVEDLLIGDRDARFQAGIEGKPLTDQGLLPWWYGRHVREKTKEGQEAEDADRKDKLARLASMSEKLSLLKDQDTEYHRIKKQMLLNGAYYEDGDRFTKLSPHAQVAYAQQKLNLYHESIESKLSVWMTSSEDVLNINGTEYRPVDLLGMTDAPLALREHAINVGLDKLRYENGITGFNKDFLELSGTLEKEKEVKANMMKKYRDQWDIDASQKELLKQAREFVSDGDYDFNRFLQVVSSLKNPQGNYYGYAGGWDEVMKLLKSMGVNGELTDEVWDRIARTPNPRQPGETYGDYIDEDGVEHKGTHQFRFDKLKADIEEQINSNLKGALKEDENNRLILHERFKKLVDAKRAQGLLLDERDLAFFQAKWTTYNGQGEPDWLKNYVTIQDKDAKDQLNQLQIIYDTRGFITPEDLWGMHPEVWKTVTEKEGILTKSNESGAAEGAHLLKDKGEGTWHGAILEHVKDAVARSGGDGSDIATGLGRAIPYWQQRYAYYRVQKDLPETDAAKLATEDVYNELNKYAEAKDGRFNIFSSAKPTDTSWMFKTVDIQGEEYQAYRLKKAKGQDFIRNGFDQHGDSRFLAKEGGIIPGTGGADGDLANAVKYLQGKGPLPQIYIELANEFPGLTGDKLARWQVQAAIASGQFADSDIDVNELLESKNINSAAYDALDLDQHSEVGKLLGFKSSPFSHCQAKACINDQLAAIRSGDQNLKTTQFGTGTQVSEESDDAKLLEDGHVQPKGEEKNITEQAADDLQVDLETATKRENEIPVLRNIIYEKIKSAQEKGHDRDEAIDLQISTSTSLEKDKDIINQYYGGGQTYAGGGTSDKYAKLKYTLALLLNQEGSLGADGELSPGIQALFNNKGELDLGQLGTKVGDEPVVFGEINHEVANKTVEQLLSATIDPTSVQFIGSYEVPEAKLTGDYNHDIGLTWVKKKIESGEWQLIPILDGEDITAEEAKARYNEPKPISIPQIGSFLGSEYLLGVPYSRPRIDQVEYRIIDNTVEPTNNLQSSLNVPGSPYLATNLQEYAGQLIAFNVGIDPTIPIKLEDATDDITKWNWVVDQARKAGAQYPELIAAQFMLESGRGLNVSGTHNYFGLKTTATDPESTWLETSEWKDGKWVRVMAPFKNFDSPEAAIKYLSRLWYKDFGAYKGANNAQDINGAIQVLVNGGYATDPEYAEKLLKILQEFEKLKTPQKITMA